MRKPVNISLLIALTLISGAAISPVRAEDAATLDGLGVPAVSNSTLGKANGKEGLSLNNANLGNTSAFNEANNAQSGAASIGAGALSNINGTTAVVVNSGQNAVVQVSQQIIFNLY